MVKITINDNSESVTLKIEGRVADIQVPEFQRVWQQVHSSLGSRALQIDLCGVTFMDQAGRNLLASIYAQTGAQLLANTPMTKYFAEEAIRAKQDYSNGVNTGGSDERSLRT